ncbi:MAG: hypothetical protein LBL95_00410 [Deltaproteobacteria bacterium]|jgi:chromosome segregation ATPase|nr:hypothetical protein [Deltaproteobacteria bacterium]
MKTFISALGLVGLVVFLILWLVSSSDLRESREQARILESRLSDLEASGKASRKSLTDAESGLKDAQASLDQANSSLKARDSELARLKEDNEELSRNLSALEREANDLKAGQARVAAESEALKQAHHGFLDQVGTLSASLSVATEERDELRNRLDQALKTLAIYRGR